MTETQHSPWEAPATVAGFATGAPNAELMRFAEGELKRAPGGRALDVGCGAGRNAIPLARMGWELVGADASAPMLDGAARGVRAAGVESRVHLIRSSMDHLPVSPGSCDLLIAHGIWNLARSGDEFRRAAREAARAARPGASLFVFTFSRNTLPPQAAAVAGEEFVFTEFSGQPQCFLTETQLLSELGKAGFVPHESFALREYNRPQPGCLPVGAGPVIYEAAFRRLG